MPLFPSRPILVSACAFWLTAVATAQTESVLFAFSSDHQTLDGGGGLFDAGRIRPDEVGVVTPMAGGFYSARGLISVGTQWAWRGDDDNDGNWVDSSTAAPGNDTDAIMVKRFLGATATPTVRDVCISKEDNYSTSISALDGDVIYHPTQGTVAKFVTEAQIATATGASSIDVDAICQDFNGDLYISFDVNESMTGGTGDDSGIIRIPAAAITYDPVTGDVVSTTGGLAEILSDEPFLRGTIDASGIRSNAGATPHVASSIDLQGLDIDPTGGTWTSPLTGGTYPNLLLSWESGASGDGGIVSTASGGAIPNVNGVAMGSPVATTGTHLGLAPTSTGLTNLVALAVVADLEIPTLVENYPEYQLTTSDFGFSTQQVTGATPLGTVAFILTIQAATTGGALSSVPLLAPFGGELFEPASLIVTTTTVADSLGYASQTLDVSSLVGSGLHINWQVFDAGTFTFSLPAPIQFL